MSALVKLKTYLGITDNDEDALLSLLIEQSETAILNKRYPFGYTEEDCATALSRYSNTLIDIAVYLYSKRGAEGQTSHSENGVSRGYESAGIPDSYLVDIVPMCKVL